MVQETIRAISVQQNRSLKLSMYLETVWQIYTYIVLFQNFTKPYLVNLFRLNLHIWCEFV